jgi:hypothetical protein
VLLRKTRLFGWQLVKFIKQFRHYELSGKSDKKTAQDLSNGVGTNGMATFAVTGSGILMEAL